MRGHAWQYLILDGGHIGGYEIWECARCGATSWGEPAEAGQPSSGQFLACGCGPDVTELPDDCDEALAWIERHRESCPRGARSD